MKYTVREIANITGGKLYRLSGDEVVTGVSMDSRTVKKGDLFFGIRGEHFDGSTFAKEAVDKGAVCAVVPEYKRTENVPSILVDEPVMAMGRLAKNYLLSKLRAKVIGITGSVGKTTTKDLIHRLLSIRFKTSKTMRSFNGFIGLPFTILNAREDDNFLVLEYGISKPYEMDYLVSIAEPDVAVLTKVGKSHLEFLNTEEEVAIEKAKLFKTLKMFDIAILNRETPFLDFFEAALPKMVRVVYYQTPEIIKMDIEGTVFKFEDEIFETPLIGRHIITNLTAAIITAKTLGVPIEDIKEEIKRISPSPMRMETLSINGFKIINDAYNANPESMKALIDTVKDMKLSGEKIFVLGDMLELGPKSPIFHEDIGRYLSEHVQDAILFSFGELAQNYIKGARKLSNKKHFSDINELVNEILNRKSAYIFIKASRGMQLERVIEKLKERV